MLTKHLALTFSMVWTIVISNILVVVVSFAVINHLAKITSVRGAFIHTYRFISHLHRRIHRE